MKTKNIAYIGTAWEANTKATSASEKMWQDDWDDDDDQGDNFVAQLREQISKN